MLGVAVTAGIVFFDEESLVSLVTGLDGGLKLAVDDSNNGVDDGFSGIEVTVASRVELSSSFTMWMFLTPAVGAVVPERRKTI